MKMSIVRRICVLIGLDQGALLERARRRRRSREKWVSPSARFTCPMHAPSVASLESGALPSGLRLASEPSRLRTSTSTVGTRRATRALTLGVATKPSPLRDRATRSATSIGTGGGRLDADAPALHGEADFSAARGQAQITADREQVRGRWDRGRPSAARSDCRNEFRTDPTSRSRWSSSSRAIPRAPPSSPPIAAFPLERGARDVKAHPAFAARPISARPTSLAARRLECRQPSAPRRIRPGGPPPRHAKSARRTPVRAVDAISGGADERRAPAAELGRRYRPDRERVRTPRPRARRAAARRVAAIERSPWPARAVGPHHDPTRERPDPLPARARVRVELGRQPTRDGRVRGREVDANAAPVDGEHLEDVDGARASSPTSIVKRLRAGALEPEGFAVPCAPPSHGCSPTTQRKQLLLESGDALRCDGQRLSIDRRRLRETRLMAVGIPSSSSSSRSAKMTSGLEAAGPALLRARVPRRGAREREREAHGEGRVAKAELHSTQPS